MKEITEQEKDGYVNKCMSANQFRNRVVMGGKEPRNRFQGIDSASLCSLAGRYDNPIPNPFLAPTDCSKIPALVLPPSLPTYCNDDVTLLFSC